MKKSIKMSQKTQRWEWAIALDLDNLSDHHLQKAYKLNWDNLCKFDSCRKNCKRILCLACFDRTWIDNDAGGTGSYENFETSICEIQKRTDLKSFVGLKNLGATCYVNCLLQLWFHNPALRKAIYEWKNNMDDNHDSTQQLQIAATNESETDIVENIRGNNSTDRVAFNQDVNETQKYIDELAEQPQSSAKRFKTSQDEGSTPNGTSKISTSEQSIELVTLSQQQNQPSTVQSIAGSSSPYGYNNNTIKKNPIEQLQLIFARMQFTNNKSIDPYNFIESLALNATEQQDAQEFGNLFIEFLEKSCANQKNSFVSNIIKNQFMGRYSYATICDHCKHKSILDSTFYELDLSIQNLDTLHECLNKYFKPVPLDGKYNCSHCRKAQSAHRLTTLKSLPPTLNLQLLRFVYDTQRNTRQKLNSFIIFPEILDMTPYLNDAKSNGTNSNRLSKPNPFDLSNTPDYGIFPSNGLPKDRSNIYVLSAVLSHRGSSPHSGHYIAHIKDRITRDWYKFNDDVVERIGPQLQISTEGENISIVEDRTYQIKFNDPSSGKVIKMESKSLKSKTAYMLVYQAHDNEALTYPSDHSEKWQLPDHLQTAVAEENSRSDELFESLEIAREVDVQVMNARKTQIRTIYDKLVCRDPSEKYEFIDRLWLQNWLTNSSTSAKFPPIDNSNLLCIHDKLDFRKLDQVKCVRSEGADLLYNEFGGGPRLQDAMCRQCVEFEVKLIQLKERMKEDQKFMTSRAKFTLKPGYDFADAYIVGKNSYRDWQTLVMLRFERSHPELMGRRQSNQNHSSDEDDNNNNQDPETRAQDKPTETSSKNGDDSESSDDDEAMEKFVFNSDILCEHGQLVNDALAWRIVPKEVWAIFSRYFGDDPERPLIERNANTIMCAECKRQEVEQQEIGDIQKQIASEQKSKLLELFHNRKRASWCSMVPGDEYYALDRHFLTRWQKFVRNPCNQEQPTQVEHSEKLVCKSHQMSLYNFSNSNPLLPECPFVLISPQELQQLKQMYSVDHDVRFYVDPKIAEETVRKYKANQKQTKQKSLQQGPNPDNSIRQLNNPGGDQNDPIKSTNVYCAPQSEPMVTSSGDCEPEVATLDSTKDEIDYTDIDWTECVVSDPPYCSECHEILKQDELKKLLNYESATIYITKCENRTARRNRSREQAYNIRPTQTLLELKKEIFNRCQVLPVDQRLFLEDVLLDDNAKTMSELRIVPNCSLKLEVSS